jgi:hypothetical protein
VVLLAVVHPQGCDGGVLAMQRKFMRGMGHKMNEKPSEEMSKR